VRSRDPVPPVQTDQQTSTAQGPPVPSSDRTKLSPEQTDQTIKSELRDLEKKLAEEKAKNPDRYTVKQSNLEDYITTLKQSLTGKDDIRINGKIYKAGDTIPPEDQEAYNRFIRGQQGQ